jgi:hypothetical protein
MKALLAATAVATGLILVGAIGGRTPGPAPAQPAVSTPAQGADAAAGLVMLEKEPALVPHAFSNQCFMAAAYRRYQLSASGLDDAQATASNLDAYFVDMVYVATDQPCPGTQAHTAQRTPTLQTIQ